MSISDSIISWLPSSNITTSGEVTLIVSDGVMSDTELFTISVSGGTGITKTNSETITIYPNPVSESFIVEGFSGMTPVDLYNAQGCKVLTEKAVSNGENIDISTLPAGIYMLAIKSVNATIQEKIVKE